MTTDEFAELLSLGHEVRGIEFKPSGPRTDRVLFANVVRAALGMSNIRDGGRIVLGVEEAGNTLNPVGLADSDLLTWNYDHIADSFGPYADPSIQFHVAEAEYQAKRFIIIWVYQFEEIPILCNKDETISGRVVLRKGACYVRSRRKPETTEIPTQEDMRALLDLATDKGIARWISRAQTAGIYLPGTVAPSDQERFNQQLEDLR